MINQELVKRAIKNDPDALEELYNELKGYVWGVAYSFIGNRQDAEEIVSDAFVKIFKNLRKYRFLSSLETWVYRLTINTAINYLRKMKKSFALLDEERMDYLINDEKDVFGRLEEKDLVEKMLRGIDEKDRAILVLREIRGLSYNDISKICSMNVNTVKTRIYRAREALIAEYNRDKEKDYDELLK